MSVLNSQSRFTLFDSSINLARIAAYSATVSIHIIAFLFLMVPVSIPHMAKPADTRTEIIFIEPVKPTVLPAPITPVKLKSINLPIKQPSLPIISKPVQTQNSDVTTSEPIAGDVYVPD